MSRKTAGVRATSLFYLNVIRPFADIADCIKPVSCILPLTVLLRRFSRIPMARVTVEDCLARIPNHFDLCQIAAKRARQLARGAEAHLPWGDHKSTVLTLKEIAGGFIGMSVMSEADLPAIQVSKMDLELPELAPDI